MKKIFFSLLLVIYIFSFPRQSFAQSDKESNTSYHVTYAVAETGMTHTTFVASLENTKSDYYISSYAIQLGFQEIKNVTATDDNGKIQPEVTKNKQGTLITLHFNKKALGLHTILAFKLSFDTPDVAQKIGHIWEINIPGIGKQTNFSNFTVHVDVPPSFGKASFIKPVQFADKLDFTKEQLGSSGISITFGQKQVYAFHLTYHLENKNLFPIQTEIALPPMTNYQDIAIENITPIPQNVIKDKDGNWLAQYTLLPAKKITVMVKGTVFVQLVPKQEHLSSNEIARYLQPQPYWQTKDAEIQKLAKQLQTPEKIYEYVRTHITYDFSRVTIDQKRLGGAYVLQHPQSAVCLEFTDLFISLARAAGIPSREIDGFAYTQNASERPLLNDVLHAWPEYYDTNTQTWQMIDPTWGNTTNGVDYFHVLDFDHVAFVVRGVSSAYPIPAGGYKLLGQENEKDVTMTFPDNMQLSDPKLAITNTVSQEVIAGIPITGSISVSNAGQTLVPQQKLFVTTTGITPVKQVLALQEILPYGHITVPIKFNAVSFLTNSPSTVTIQVGSTAFSKSIAIMPFYLKKEIIVGGGIIVIFCIIIYIFAKRSWRLSIS